MTINDKTKVPLFAALLAVPSLVVICFWFAQLRADTNTAISDNQKQDKQIEELNEKLEIVYEMRTDIKSIKTVLKIKEEASLERPQTTTNN